MPFCKLGGADFVAGVLTSTLSQAGRVLVLRTDAADWARPDWFPDVVETVDLSDYFGPLDAPTRMRMLYELIVKIRPKSVYNINSRLAFETFERYGERLALVTHLHAYYFCADRTPEGVEVGYPVWYFSKILPVLTTALIDNNALAQQLIERFNLTGAYREKVRVVYTPSISILPSRPIAAEQIDRAAKRPRRRILWAGRLDRQKRFDLVKAIANLLPDVDFDCWGKAVLDSAPDLSSLPPNMTLNDPFKTYDDLPLRNADGWLYTSGWDGIPTILIELAALGVPIVASAVGGVPEVIDETTGWPLDETATAEDYARAINAMLVDFHPEVSRFFHREVSHL
jgi:glycosyltransferase involved in cell wall biosynthesis